MGTEPYVRLHVIESGRYRPTGRVRVVEYVDPYPIRSTKRVRVVDLGDRGHNGNGSLPSRMRSKL